MPIHFHETGATLVSSIFSEEERFGCMQIKPNINLLTSNQSNQLITGDVFDIELSDATRVWTVARGKMVVLEDVTD